MISNFLNSILPTIEHVGALSYWLVLLIFFIEGIVFFGLFVPGTFIAIFLGALASKGAFHLGDLILFSSFGFILGDILSYYLGTRGTNLFKEENRILKLAHIERGQAFFEKHGAKSVFFGRFIGFARPLIPFIAGISKMNFYRFATLDTISIFFWTTLHILIGYFFGQAFALLKIWAGRLEMFLFAVVAALLVFYSIKWLIFKKGKDLWLVINSVWASVKEAAAANSEFIRFKSQHPGFFDWLNRRFDKQSFNGSALSLLSLALLYLLYTLSKIIYGIVSSNYLVDIDNRVENLMHAFRSSYMIKTFLFLTYLGEAALIIFFALGLTIFLYYAKKRDYLLPLWVTLGGAGLTSHFLKAIVHRPRPSVGYYLESSFSFPSLHAALAAAFFGFLIYLGWRNLTVWKSKINWLFSWLFIIIIVGFSRIYLDVHFLSDVWGGYLVGLAWLTLGIGLHINKSFDKPVTEPTVPEIKKLKALAWLIITIELISFISLAAYFKSKINLNRIEGLPEITTADILQTFDDYQLDRQSESLIGENEEPLNFIISADDDAQLIAAFEAIGWKKAAPLNYSSFKEAAKMTALAQPYEEMPTTKTFWETNINDLTFKKIGQKKRIKEKHLVRLWRTNFKTPNNKAIYVGVANLELTGKLLPAYKTAPDVDSERELVFKLLKDNKKIASWSKHDFVEAILGKKASGDQFFTDGKIYIVDLR